MLTQRNFSFIAAALLALAIVSPAHGFDMNKSISIEAGGHSGGESTLNGSISVGEAAVVDGNLETVNGAIRVDDNATIEDAETVNGSVHIASTVKAGSLQSVNGSVSVGDDSTIDGGIDVVNGRISLGSGSSVSEDVSNINGEIQLDGADIGGSLTTVNGDITLSGGSTLQGDLVVERPRGGNWSNSERKPRIIVGPGSRVVGEIRLEREVELYISDSAEVGGVSGVMSMSDAERFSGERP